MQQIMLLHAHLADFELMRRVRAGTIDCYEVLIRRYTRLVYRVSRLFGLDAVAAEQLSVEVFAEAYNERHTMKEANYYRNWLAKEAIRRCRILTIDNTDFSNYLREEEEDEEEVQLYVATDKLNTLEKSIDALPFSLKAPVILCSLESFTPAEAADLLGLSEDIMQARISLANARLRGRLLKWYYNTDVFTCEDACSDRIVSKVMANIK